MGAEVATTPASRSWYRQVNRGGWAGRVVLVGVVLLRVVSGAACVAVAPGSGRAALLGKRLALPAVVLHPHVVLCLTSRRPAASGGRGATASPSASGSPTSRHYAALRAGPTYEPAARPPCGRPLRTRLAVSDVASAPCVGLWSGGESQGQVRLRRAGSESRGGSVVRLRFRVVVGSGRVLPSPGTGGNQSSAGSSTGDSSRGCRILLSPVALPAEPWSGYACQAKGAPDLGGKLCAALRADSATHRSG